MQKLLSTLLLRHVIFPVSTPRFNRNFCYFQTLNKRFFSAGIAGNFPTNKLSHHNQIELNSNRSDMSCITLTFAECGENHVGMEQIGVRGEKGFSFEDMERMQRAFPDKQTELIRLHDLMKDRELPEAYLLVIRNAFPSIADGLRDVLSKKENVGGVDWDSKVYMYGRVVNKKARHNLMFCELGEEEGLKIEANYEEKQGTIYNIHHIPLLQSLHSEMRRVSGQPSLIIEGNYYYDVKDCYIGAHGDTERKMVLGYRLGSTFPLHYQWYDGGSPISDVCTIALYHGDMYVMSDKAVGWDWKRSSIPTLRHGAGPLRFFANKKHAKAMKAIEAKKNKGGGKEKRGRGDEEDVFVDERKEKKGRK
jgi:hypothetical protein